MTDRSTPSPRPRSERGTSALVAQYIRELSSSDRGRRRGIRLANGRQRVVLAAGERA